MRQARQQDNVYSLSFGLGWLGFMLREAGRLEEAEHALLEAIPLNDRFRPDVWVRCNLSAVYSRQGRLPEARNLLDEARAKAGLQPGFEDELRLQTAEARLAVAEKRPAEALAAYEAVAQARGRMGFRWDRACTLREWAEAYLSRRSSPSGNNEPGDRERALALLREALSEFEAMDAPGWAAQVSERLREVEGAK